MLSADLIERLCRLAAFPSRPEEVAARLQRLVATSANRWRRDWIAALFPGLSDSDQAALMAAILAGPPRQPARFVPARLERLRLALAELALDGFVVPQADEHLSEYIPAHNQRLAWLTGFTGSAGTAVVTRDRAWLFIDGRYMEQARLEVEADHIEARHFRKPPLWQFLAQTLERGSRLGYDPRLHAVEGLELAEKELSKSGIELVAVAQNPIDALWTERPAQPFSPIAVQPLERAGRAMGDKLDAVAAALRAENIDAVLFSQLDSIAWLYNIRGGDVPSTPVADAFSLVFADGRAELFLEAEKLTPAAREHLGNHAVRAMPEFETALAEIGARKLTVGLDPSVTTAWVKATITAAGGTVRSFADPSLFERLRKNKTEIENIKDAMVRDGVCLARFLHWFHSRPAGALPDELELADALEAFRAADPLYRGPSFPAIVGVDANGAIVHYHATAETNRRLAPGLLVLIDSGGQFLTGTTDITRTLIHSAPTAEQRRIFTTVLKGHIALASSRFLKGAVGAQLDAVARAPLWQIGINYDHGTGHGIGAFLGVHEGPVRIAPGGNLALEANMLLSNEPGAYLSGKFGIRLENSVLVVEAGEGETGDAFLGFETLSLAPFDRQLIDAGLLSAPERAWLDDYHARVLALIGPHLAADDAAWLKAATRPL